MPFRPRDPPPRRPDAPVLPDRAGGGNGPAPCSKEVRRHLAPYRRGPRPEWIPAPPGHVWSPFRTHRLAVSAPPVILGSCHQTRPDGIEVDIRGYSVEGGLPPSMRTLLKRPSQSVPERPRRRLRKMETRCLSSLRKTERSPRRRSKRASNFPFPRGIARSPGGFELRGYGFHGGLVVEELEERNEGLRGQPRNRIARGNLDEEVEVIAHEAVGGNADRAERLEFAKDRAEDLLFTGMEDDAFVDDAGNAMIESAIRRDDS